MRKTKIFSTYYSLDGMSENKMSKIQRTRKIIVKQNPAVP
jgi:hypothetical protein